MSAKNTTWKLDRLKPTNCLKPSFWDRSMGSLSFQKVPICLVLWTLVLTDCLHLGPRGKVELAQNLKSNASSKEVWFTVWHWSYLTFLWQNKPLSRPFEFKFRKQRNAYDLSTATEFISLLADIRNHLLRSQSTRAIYFAMAEKFFLRSKKEVRDISKKPQMKISCHTFVQIGRYSSLV
jgi:hypothetical protein